jgi:hypothetical protein
MANWIQCIHIQCIGVRPTSKWRERVPMNSGCELVELRLLFMFYRGAAIHHLFILDSTRVGDITCFPCNAVPPNHDWNKHNRATCFGKYKILWGSPLPPRGYPLKVLWPGPVKNYFQIFKSRNQSSVHVINCFLSSQQSPLKLDWVYLAGLESPMTAGPWLVFVVCSSAMSVRTTDPIPK